MEFLVVVIAVTTFLCNSARLDNSDKFNKLSEPDMLIYRDSGEV